MKNTLGDWIGGRLIKSGQTQRDLAQAIHTNSTNISRWIKGQRPTLDFCLAIAAYFGEKPEKIIEMTGNAETLARYREMTSRATRADQLETDKLSPEDIETHRRLQAVLDRGGSFREGMVLHVDAVYLHAMQAREQHGPFSPRPRPAKHTH